MSNVEYFGSVLTYLPHVRINDCSKHKIKNNIYTLPKKNLRVCLSIALEN